MLGNVALDVFISLTFIFLLYSLLATILQEIIARWLDLRARMLVKAIRNMLEDKDASSTRIRLLSSPYTASSILYSCINGITRFFNPFIRGEASFTKAFFERRAIKELGENKWMKRPSYLSGAEFSVNLMHMLRGSEYDGAVSQMSMIRKSLFQTGSFEDQQGRQYTIDTETLQRLKAIYLDAREDEGRFSELLEKWFNEMMNRTTGWYKRQTQLILFCVGLFLAWLFNADTIAIYHIVSKDKAARDAIVQLAVKAPEQYKPYIDSLQKKVKRDSTAVYKRDTATGKTDSSVIIGYTYRDSVYITASDSFLRSTQQQLSGDITDVQQILGLGKPLVDSINYFDSVQSICKKTGQDSLILKRYEVFKQSRKTFQYSPKQAGGWTTLLGWMLTAFAVSLGAAFWFDLLSKVTSIRAGKKPEDPTNTTDTVSPLKIKG